MIDMAETKPVKLKIYPVYGCIRGVYGITSSRSRCGACDAVVPDDVKFCPGCGVPIYGRVGEGSYIKCFPLRGLYPGREALRQVSIL